MKTTFVLGLLACTTTSVLGDSLFFYPVADATIYQGPAGGPFLANGAGHYLFVGNNNNGLSRRALVRFDFTDIPAGSTITGVTIRLVVSQAQAGAQPCTMHRLTSSWTEGASAPGGNEGGGTGALAGDVTWFHRTLPSPLWSTPGGDFVATPSTAFVLDDLATYVIPSTPGLVADVQAWIDGQPNDGWILRGNETEFGTAKRFASRQNADLESIFEIDVAFDPPSACPSCVADFNDSGGTPDDADVAAFFDAWNNGEACADANGSGGTPDDADVATFFELWNAGGC